MLEVGLGGRLDATNLVDADVAVLVSVGFDHRDWLGDTLEQIGAEKAGIFRRDRPAVLGTADMPATVFAAVHELGARAVVAERDFHWRLHGADLGLPGPRGRACRPAAVGARRRHPVSQCRHRARGARVARVGCPAFAGRAATRAARRARCACRCGRPYRGASGRTLPGGARRGGVDSRHRAQRAGGAGARRAAGTAAAAAASWRRARADVCGDRRAQGQGRGGHRCRALRRRRPLDGVRAARRARGQRGAARRAPGVARRQLRDGRLGGSGLRAGARCRARGRSRGGVRLGVHGGTGAALASAILRRRSGAACGLRSKRAVRVPGFRAFRPHRRCSR